MTRILMIGAMLAAMLAGAVPAYAAKHDGHGGVGNVSGHVVPGRFGGGHGGDHG